MHFDLPKRCIEILERHRTGILCDGLVRKMAETMPGHDWENLHLAELATASEAMQFVIDHQK